MIMISDFLIEPKKSEPLISEWRIFNVEPIFKNSIITWWGRHGSVNKIILCFLAFQINHNGKGKLR